MKSKIIMGFIVILSYVAIYRYTAPVFEKAETLSVALDSVQTVARNTILEQKSKLDELTVENSKLKNALNKYDLKIKSYQKLIARYEIQMQTIETKTDTVYVNDTAYLRRSFEKVIGNELQIKGSFETYPPYNLYIDYLKLKINPEIIITQDKAGHIGYLIDTHSDYLSVDDFKISVQKERPPLFDLSPEIYMYMGFGFPSNTIGLMAKIRIWKTYPSVVVSNHSVSFGVGVKIYEDK